jgi:hypothetical protein
MEQAWVGSDSGLCPVGQAAEGLESPCVPMVPPQTWPSALPTAQATGIYLACEAHGCGLGAFPVSPQRTPTAESGKLRCCPGHLRCKAVT